MKLNYLENHVSECAMIIQVSGQGLKYIKHTVIPSRNKVQKPCHMDLLYTDKQFDWPLF